jgi:translation initiation factor IF-1
MSNLIFEAIVIKVEANKVCKVYLKDDSEQKPIIGYLKEKVTSDKKQRLREGDTVVVSFSPSDTERCMIIKKVIVIDPGQTQQHVFKKKKPIFKKKK